MKVCGSDVRTLDITRFMTDTADVYSIASGLSGGLTDGSFADVFTGGNALLHGATAVCQGVAWLAALNNSNDCDYSAGRHFINALGDAAACAGYGMAASGVGGIAPILFGAAGSAVANLAQFACE